ncbi:UDP-glucuronosyltransferase 2B15-like [Anoplophora glabripennis]|uniref:UDP-glucuronosyltransferase 2B15-like n=1 Tax=Anoplophora glabripennis TaxID=217634 RepID=UPI000873AC2D|nr:UDP-glucuronosyltransferase 2B15-like [Anoplophora glabripennis]
MRSVIIITILAVAACTESKKVLGIYSHPGKSHQIMGEVILKKLAERGHEVTMVSAYPLKNPIPNYKDIVLDGFLEDLHSDDNIYLEMEKNALLNFLGAFDLIHHFMDKTFGHPAMQKLIQSGEKFDLIIIDWFCKEAELFYANIFEAPVIFTSSFGAQYDMNYVVNNAEPYSYLPVSGFPFTDEMDFSDRFGNTLAIVLVKILMLYNKIHNQRILNKHFKNAPSIDELMGNVDLVLSNAHPIFETPRPYVPNIICIGGVHIQETKPLPQDLKDFLDKSHNGVVYFSLGSHMKTSALPKDVFNSILRAFSRIPQNVLLKWEEDEVPVLPDNVMVKKWMPQDSVLAHPNVRVFITHGGLMGKIEAIYHATPMIGIPFFGDQITNVIHSVQEGIGIILLLSEVTEDTLFDAVYEIINNSSYSENVMKKSALLKDQPMKPIDVAVYWSEFVMRHNGSKHLQNKGMRLNVFQTLLLDVILVITVAVVAITLIIWKLFLLLVRLLTKKGTSRIVKSKSKEN